MLLPVLVVFFLLSVVALIVTVHRCYILYISPYMCMTNALFSPQSTSTINSNERLDMLSLLNTMIEDREVNRYSNTASTFNLYNENVLRELMYLLCNVYVNRKDRSFDIADEVQRFQYQLVNILKLDGDKPFIWFYVSQDDEYSLYVTIRSTTYKEEFIHDLHINQVQLDMEDVKAHTGFTRIYNSVQDQLILFVDEWIDSCPDRNKYMIYILGHSMGGSIATLLAYTLNRYNAVVYTIGTPYTINQSMNDKIITPLYNIINESDDYAKFLSSSIIRGNITDIYVRAGTIIYFEDNRGYHDQNHSLRAYYENIVNYKILMPIRYANSLMDKISELKKAVLILD